MQANSNPRKTLTTVWLHNSSTKMNRLSPENCPTNGWNLLPVCQRYSYCHIQKRGIQWRIRGPLCEALPFGGTAVIFVTILRLFLAPFKDKITATSDQMRFWGARKCSKMRLRMGSALDPTGGAYSAPPALPTSLLLTHVALCQCVRGVTARTRYINVLTYLLTYISSTIGCANFGPEWHEIWSLNSRDVRNGFFKFGSVSVRFWKKPPVRFFL